MMKPVMPYVTDTIAHILFFKDHLETVHAQNGKMHVHTELAAAEKNDSTERDNTLLKKYSFGNEYLILERNQYPSTSFATNLFKGFMFHVKNMYIKQNFPPPKI